MTDRSLYCGWVTPGTEPLSPTGSLPWLGRLRPSLWLYFPTQLWFEFTVLAEPISPGTSIKPEESTTLGVLLFSCQKSFWIFEFKEKAFSTKVLGYRDFWPAMASEQWIRYTVMVIEFLIADCLLVNIITPFIQKKYFLSGKQYFNKSFNTEVNRTNKYICIGQ